MNEESSKTASRAKWFVIAIFAQGSILAAILPVGVIILSWNSDDHLTDHTILIIASAASLVISVMLARTFLGLLGMKWIGLVKYPELPRERRLGTHLSGYIIMLACLWFGIGSRDLSGVFLCIFGFFHGMCLVLWARDESQKQTQDEV